jgi:hypothetical protein
VILDIILLLSHAWCGREECIGRAVTYHLLRSGLFRRALSARDAHKSRVEEKKSATDSEFAKKRCKLGGEARAHGSARRSSPAFEPLTRCGSGEEGEEGLEGFWEVSGVHNDN